MVSWAWALAAMGEILTFALLSRVMHRYHELSLLGFFYVVRLLPPEFGSTGQSLLAMVFLGLAGITGGTVGGWISVNGVERACIFLELL